MNIVVSGIHLREFPEMEDYAKKKVSKLNKFHPKIKEIRVRLISQKSHREKTQDYDCQIEVDIPGKNLSVLDTEELMDKAIDKAFERMKRALVKHKEKQITVKHKLGILSKLRNRLPW
ncbi:ribosome-associated translation inhibitor RaiA [Candidatus Curtissbacteria bacterium]|nr:ribosome-associated translation inhibitor RaiA [Candidatus Curtissbacteria bacterium]